MFDLFLDIIGVAVENLRQNKTARAWVMGLSLFFIVLILGIWGAASASIIINQDITKTIKEAAPVFLFIFGFILFLALVSFTHVKIKGGGSIQLELNTLHEERQKIQDRLSDTEKPNVLDTIQLNLNQLSEYYTINKSQARNSFRFSVFAVIAGLSTIIAGVWFFYLQETPNVSLTIISGISGTMIQFIGAAYFYLYRKSLDQLNFFFSQLVKMQDTMLSVKLCEEVTPQEKQIELREKVIITLLERSSLPIASPKVEKGKP